VHLRRMRSAAFKPHLQKPQTLRRICAKRYGISYLRCAVRLETYNPCIPNRFTLDAAQPILGIICQFLA
jgi:hypothetical protein